MPKTISLHNTPQFYLEYVRNWVVKARKEKANPVEVAIVEDIAKLIEIAVESLEPNPAAPGNN